ncbi:MAG: hypothetical protein C5B53_11770 [Candidatus Melainabacteria bacterium]|nr:MAG: hypothetical protein C5B53_11770 [Candidatus Melainabacteria bacterium]
MVTFDLLGQAYAISAAAGSGFFLLSFLAGFGHPRGAVRGHAFGRGTGRIGHSTGRGGARVSHSGSHSAGRAAHGTSHSGSHSSGRAGGRASTHSIGRAGRSGNYTGGQESGGQNAETSSAQLASSSAPSAAAQSLLLNASTSNEEWAMRLLMLFNPFYISVFLTFFGLTGLFCLSVNKSLGPISLLPAIFAGFLVNWLFQALVQWMVQKFESVAPVATSDLIGHAAVISVPIVGTRVGEITYVVHAKRHTIPAKSLNPSDEFKKGNQVVISEIKDSTAYVEPWVDDFDPGLKETLVAFNSPENPSNETTDSDEQAETNV